MDVKRKKRAEKGRTECEEHSCGSGPTYIRSDQNPDKFFVPDQDTVRWSDPNPECFSSQVSDAECWSDPNPE